MDTVIYADVVNEEAYLFLAVVLFGPTTPSPPPAITVNLARYLCPLLLFPPSVARVDLTVPVNGSERNLSHY